MWFEENIYLKIYDALYFLQRKTKLAKFRCQTCLGWIIAIENKGEHFLHWIFGQTVPLWLCSSYVRGRTFILCMRPKRMTCGTSILIRLSICCPLVAEVPTLTTRQKISPSKVLIYGLYVLIFFKPLLKNACIMKQ